MAGPVSSIDVVRERELYVEAVRRASSLGSLGREALRDAHEVFAAAMLAAGRPELASDAVASLVAAAPNCPSTLTFAANMARLSGAVAQALRWERRAAGVATSSRFKPRPHLVDKRSGAA